jgi:hypothetical protein
MPSQSLKQYAPTASAKDDGAGVPPTPGGARDSPDCSHIARGSLGFLCAQRAGPRGNASRLRGGRSVAQSIFQRACGRRLRDFRREACRSAARSKSQLLSPAPLLPSQPSFCTFSNTSFVTSPLPSWSCQPFVHDSTVSGPLAAQPAPCPAAAARHFGEARGAGSQPRHALDVSWRWAPGWLNDYTAETGYGCAAYTSEWCNVAKYGSVQH